MLKPIRQFNKTFIMVLVVLVVLSLVFSQSVLSRQYLDHEQELSTLLGKIFFLPSYSGQTNSQSYVLPAGDILLLYDELINEKTAPLNTDKPNLHSATVPVVYTLDPRNDWITSNSAYIAGGIISDGGAPIQMRALSWGISSFNENIATDLTHNIIIDGDLFYYQITGLAPDTTYRYIASARNSVGYGHGEVKQFTTKSQQDTEPLLVVHSLIVEPETSSLSTELTATIVIRNQGKGNANSSFYVDFYKNRTNAPKAGDTGDEAWLVNGLSAGASRTFTYKYTPGNTGTMGAWAQVDTDSHISDTPHVRGPAIYKVNDDATPPPVDCVIATPNPPVGPDSGVIDETYFFSLGGASCSCGQGVEYQLSMRKDGGSWETFDFPWPTSFSMVFNEIGNYTMRTRARCANNPTIVSLWSDYHVVSITGEAQGEYSINVSANPSVGGVVVGEGVYAENETVTVFAEANSGYIFENWTEGASVVSLNSAYTFDVTGNRELVANFTGSDASGDLDLGLHWIFQKDSIHRVGSVALSADGSNIALISLPPAGFGSSYVYYLDEQGNELWSEALPSNRTRSSLAMSASGNRLIAVNSTPFSGSKAVMFDGQGQEITDMSISSSYPISSVDISPEGSYHGITVSGLIAVDRIRLFDSNNEQLFSKSIGEAGMSNIALSSEALNVAAASGGGQLGNPGVQLYTKTGSIIWDTSIADSWIGTRHFIDITWSGSYIVTGNEHGSQIYLFNSQGNLLWQYDTGSSIRAVSISRTGAYIAAGNRDGKVVILDSSGKLLWSHTLPDSVNDLDLSAYGEALVVGAGNEVYLFRSGFDPSPPVDTFSVNVTANPIHGGTVAVSGDGVFDAGEEVTVTAKANEVDGFIFGHWTENGKVVHEEASYTFTAEEDRELVANFYTHRVAFIPVRYSDGSTTDSSLFYLKKRADWVREYFLRQSYGQVVMLVDFFDEVEIDKPQSGWNSKPESRNSFFEEVLEQASILPENYDFTSDIEAFDAILVISADLEVTPFANPAEYPKLLNMAYVEERTTTKNNISISQFPYAVWAHELGHAMFKWFDYYDRDNYLWTKGSIGYWGIMGKGNYLHPPSPIMSFNKVKAGWLDYTESFLNYGDRKNLPLLHDMQAGDLIHRFKPEQGDIDYFIFEGRYPPDGMCDDMKDHKYEPGSWQRLKENKGILIYEIREKKHEVSGLKVEHVNVIPFTFPDPLNLQLIQDSERVTLDPEFFLGRIGFDASYKCDLSEVKFTASLSGAQISLEASKHVPLNRRIISFSLIPYSLLAPHSLAPNISGYVVNEFDVDLRVLTEDGLMVGMDYDKGIYRLEIEGARTSGNRMSGSPEWISIPNDIEVYYEIDYTPAGIWLEEVGIVDLSMEASIEIIEVDDQGERTTIGEETIKVELANITLTANPAVGGEVSGGGVFDPGDLVTVIAKANSGYEFVGWMEDDQIVSTEETFSFIVERGRVLEAIFEESPPDYQKVIYFQNTFTGRISAWVVDEFTVVGQPVTIGQALNLNWWVAAVHDINASGSPDLIWQNRYGRLVVWVMDGFVKDKELPYGDGFVNPNFTLVDLHDTSGDGYADAIFQNIHGGRFIWFMSGSSRVDGRRFSVANANWSIVGVNDMGMDGKTNIIFEHVKDGRRNYWTLNQNLLRIDSESGEFARTGVDWSLMAVHDMTGNGYPDIILQHADGRRSMWIMGGERGMEIVESGIIDSRSSSWTIVGAGTVYE